MPFKKSHILTTTRANFWHDTEEADPWGGIQTFSFQRGNAKSSGRYRRRTVFCQFLRGFSNAAIYWTDKKNMSVIFDSSVGFRRRVPNVTGHEKRTEKERTSIVHLWCGGRNMCSSQKNMTFHHFFDFLPDRDGQLKTFVLIFRQTSESVNRYTFVLTLWRCGIRRINRKKRADSVF